MSEDGEASGELRPGRQQWSERCLQGTWTATEGLSSLLSDDEEQSSGNIGGFEYEGWILVCEMTITMLMLRDGKRDYLGLAMSRVWSIGAVWILVSVSFGWFVSRRQRA